MVEGLEWTMLSEGPPYGKQRKLKGSRGKGQTYEKKVGRELRDLINEGRIEGELFSGQWFAFCDAHGPGFAQPDHFIWTESLVLLFECKLTQSDKAEAQLNLLYAPILAEHYQLPVLKVHTCKNLRFDPGGLRILDPLERLQRSEDILVWQYRG
jgi:hypothetical protein